MFFPKGWYSENNRPQLCACSKLLGLLPQRRLNQATKITNAVDTPQPSLSLLVLKRDAV